MNSQIAEIKEETLNLPEVFEADLIDVLIKKLEDELSSQVFDMTTEKGRKACASAAYKVARTKTALDEQGKRLVSGLKAQSAMIDKVRANARQRLDDLKEDIRRPLTEWEVAQEQIKAQIQQRIADLAALPEKAAHLDTAMYAQAINELEAHDLTEALYGTQLGGAALAKLTALKAMRITLAGKQEADRLAAEQAIKDEQARLAEIERKAAEQKAREERLEREAAEKAKKAAEDAAAKALKEAEDFALQILQKAEDERKAAELALLRQQQAAQKAIDDAIAAEKRRGEAEAKRLRDEQAEKDRAEELRKADETHRQAVRDAAVAEFVARGMIDKNAKKVVELIESGVIPHVSINF